MAVAGSDFGKYAGNLLLGNFGDGTIIGFDVPNHDKFTGNMLGIDGHRSLFRLSTCVR